MNFIWADFSRSFKSIASGPKFFPFFAKHSVAGDDIQYVQDAQELAENNNTIIQGYFNMIGKKERYRKPCTVDEAAELLLSDLLIQHLNALSKMSDNEFNLLCDHVTPYLIEEFQIWQGNDDLLESCYRTGDEESNDPARIILNRVKELLNNFSGFLVIT